MPETYRINTNILPLLAGVAIKDDPGVTKRLVDLPIDAPLLDFRSTLLLGGLTIRRIAT